MKSQTCAHCKRVFEPDYAGKQFCKWSCWRASKPRTYHDKTCPTCGKQFKTKDSRKVHCTRACHHANLAVLFRNRITLTCNECGKQYEQKPALKESSKFCSYKCKIANRTTTGHTLIKCSVCNATFQRRNSRLGEFCSYECSGIANRNRLTLTCEICKKSYEIIKSWSPTSRFCSRKCKNIHMAKNVWPYLKDKPTKIEIKVNDALVECGMEFLPQHPIGRFVVDFFLPSLSLIIEADGDYWHSLPKSKARDKSKDAYMQKCGYKVVRLAEHVIHGFDSNRELAFHIEEQIKKA